MRIVFMGTPEFAVASLDALLKANCNIIGVVTAPDKPAGRGQKVNEAAVKKFALENNLKILQPEKLKNPQFVEELRALQADLQVVVAFRMLPEIVWNMPKNGTINLHASLLPQYRGAAPINRAIMNGETESGATTFFLKHEIDTGDILFSEKVPINNSDTAGDLHDKLMKTGALLLVKTVNAIKENKYTEIPQENATEGQHLKHAPKIFKDDCEINFNQEVQKVYNHIRGLSPHPAAFTKFKDKNLKIYHADTEVKDHDILPGKFLTDEKTYIKFACTNGFIIATDIQFEGKKRMKTDEFLRGFRF
ncbi:MAG TPA: methionyl-tRNA formyltransferase [Sphingobacteriaceae bacterium]|nr:methionyl-tRNA formyltransferase [Sphingobacteriaceae bacterium]